MQAVAAYGHRQRSFGLWKKRWIKRAQKTDLAFELDASERFPTKLVAEILGVSRSNLHDRVKGATKERQSYHKAQDAEILPLIMKIAALRPAYARSGRALMRQRRSRPSRSRFHTISVSPGRSAFRQAMKPDGYPIPGPH